MQVPTPENQQFSERTLKGILLKNVDEKNKDPTVITLNKFLIARVDEFWNTVVVPLQRMKKFDGNKIRWYFEVYKEGIEARKVVEHPFTFVAITEDTIREIVDSLNGKTLGQYLELGTSYLSSCFSLLSLWQRDQLVLKRLEQIYASSDPCDWILTAEREEHGAMDTQKGAVPGVADVLNNIGLIMSRRA